MRILALVLALTGCAELTTELVATYCTGRPAEIESGALEAWRAEHPAGSCTPTRFVLDILSGASALYYTCDPCPDGRL